MASGRAGMIAIYAVGQFGWSLASYGVLNLLAYFYMPLKGEGAESLFPPFVFQGSVFAGLTLIGLIGASGRLFDAFTDPLLANWSDRTRSRLGRRRVFLLCSALPFALLSAAVFFPPAPAPGWLNSVWLACSITLFYLAMTAYVVPYNALIAELGHSAKERLNLATAISVTWALGFALGSQIYMVQDLFEQNMNSVQAFQWSIALFAGLGAMAMLVPALFLDEKRYTSAADDQSPSDSRASSKGLFAAFAQVWSNRNFRWFALSDFLYWLSLTFIQMGVAFYVVELMGRDKAYASVFMLIVFGLSFVFYAPVNWLASRWGKRRVLLAAFLLFGGAFALTASFRADNGASLMALGALQIFAAFALASFGILPNAIVGDLAEEHRLREGQAVAGMYFAVRTLIMKAGTSAAMLIFPTFLLWEQGGTRASAIAAVLFCLLGFLAFLRYKERPDAQ